MIAINLDEVESKRLSLQQQLNMLKTHGERNKLGQFATPTALATDMLRYAKALLPPNLSIQFLDPAFGSGSFLSALLRTFPLAHINDVVGYEIDEAYAKKTMELWGDVPLKLYHQDFTRVYPPEGNSQKANLLICNPPYVRHHHLSQDDKLWLQARITRSLGIKLSGLSGLYGYFLCLAHHWMAENCLAGWLIPGECLDVNYGQQIKEYLLKQVTLLRVHRFDAKDLQFNDALISSAVIWFRNTRPSVLHEVEFTYGGTLLAPLTSRSVPLQELDGSYKWSMYFGDVRANRPDAVDIDNRQAPMINKANCKLPDSRECMLSDLFEIKRGVATGANKFFILTEEQIQSYGITQKFLRPILPGPRYLSVDEVKADDGGIPLLERTHFLLSCNLVEEEVKKNDPALWEYLQIGKARGVHNGYLCSHRTPWYGQENRPPTLFLCTYMGRQNRENRSPFRFIFNQSQATATNVYLLLYPKSWLQKILHYHPELARLVWHYLNTIPVSRLIDGGRTYGDGLHKLEPGELSRIPANPLIHTLSANTGSSAILL